MFHEQNIKLNAKELVKQFVVDKRKHLDPEAVRRRL